MVCAGLTCALAELIAASSNLLCVATMGDLSPSSHIDRHSSAVVNSGFIGLEGTALVEKVPDFT